MGPSKRVSQATLVAFLMAENANREPKFHFYFVKHEISFNATAKKHITIQIRKALYLRTFLHKSIINHDLIYHTL